MREAPVCKLITYRNDCKVANIEESDQYLLMATLLDSLRNGVDKCDNVTVPVAAECGGIVMRSPSCY